MQRLPLFLDRVFWEFRALMESRNRGFMAIRWEKFTVKAQEAVQRANELASEHGNPELQPLHLPAALLEDKEGIVPPVLEKIGIGPQAVLSELYRELEKLPKVSGQASQATLSS